MREEIRNAGVTRALADVIADASDLLKQELALARTEITQALGERLRSGIYYAVAGVLLLLALLLAVQAAVFAIASYGIALHWACLIVAGAALILALVAVAIARSTASTAIFPHRTMNQIQQDIATIRGQWT